MKKLLNERQLAVLEWVGKGCPEGVWDSRGYKTSCQALQNRGLVKISRHGGQWAAALTDAGTHYLAHGAYPAAAAAAKRLPTPRLTRVAASTPSGRTTDSPLPRVRRQPRKSFTEQLLEELEADGGRIVKSGREAESWPSRVAAARRSGRIPKTKELYGGWCREGYEVKLVDTPAWRLAVLEPVAVPSRLTHPHTVVRTMQEASQPLGLSRPVQGRALRLVHALLTAVERDGHKCAAGAVETAPPSHRRRNARPHFTVTAQGQMVDLLVLQERDRSKHVPTEKEEQCSGLVDRFREGARRAYLPE